MSRYLFILDQAEDLNGEPIAGAKLNFYEADTLLRLTTYSDEALTIANTNPVIADGEGRFGDIWLQVKKYDVVFTDANDVIKESKDNVSGSLTDDTPLVTPFDLISAAAADASLRLGGTLLIKDRASSFWDVIAGTAGANGFNLIQSTGDPSLQLKLRSVSPYNVKAWGAKGDDSTDDTSAIHAVFAVAGQSEVVYFPSGVYLVTSLVQSESFTMEGDGSWGINSVGNGSVIRSSTAGVPVLEITSNASSHWSHKYLRFIANSNSTACVTVDTSHNGSEFVRCFFKGEGCPYNLTIGSGTIHRITDCYFTSVSSANILNSCARLYIDKGLADVGPNGFVRQQGNGGVLYVSNIYLEWLTTPARGLIQLANTSAPSTVHLINISQADQNPEYIFEQTGPVGFIGGSIQNYNGRGATFLYKDTLVPARNIPWTDEMASTTVIFGKGVVSVPFASNSNWIQFTTSDTTPSIASGKFFRTNNTSATTISFFEDGFTGKEIVIHFNDNNTTIDFSASALKGNGGVDFVASINDSMRCAYTGQFWLCDITES